ATGFHPTQSRLLADIILAMYLNATLARRHPLRVWRLVADEFDELSGYNFSTLVDKGRSAKSIPIMAHQNLSQLIKESDDTLYKSVTSSPIKVTLRVSSADAKEISWVRE